MRVRNKDSSYRNIAIVSNTVLALGMELASETSRFSYKNEKDNFRRRIIGKMHKRTA